MEEKAKYSPFESFRPHFDALARVAYIRIVMKNVSPIRYAIHNASRIVIWFIVFTYNLQHVIRLIQVRHSTDQMVDTLFILLTTLNTLGKQVTLNARSRRIDYIIDVLNGPVFAPRKPYHEEVMRENAVAMRRLVLFYHGCAMSCGFLWAVFPFVNKALGEDVQFTGYIPFDTSTSPAFELAVLYMNITITIQAYGNVTMDCLIVAFYAQAKVQLQALRYNLEHLADLKEDGEIDGRNMWNTNYYVDIPMDVEDSVIQRRFVRCVVHHRRIMWLIKEIESIFAEALVFQFLVTAWVICMTVYKIVGLSLFSVEFASIFMYLCCMLAQFFIYCYYGTQLKYESEFVNQSLYCGSWLCLSPRFRRQLQVLMVNCSRPITPRTAYVIPISLETYISVLRASYTLFTFLNRK